MEENVKRRKKKRSFLEIFAKENGEMSSPICWMKTKKFRIHHNRQAKNAKAGETIFQDTEKQDKTRKINVKHVQQTKVTDKILFFFFL